MNASDRGSRLERLLAWSRRRENAFLLGLCVVLFLAYNFTTLFSVNWFVHPDDYEAYMLSRHFYEHGELGYREALNEELDCPSFAPQGASYYGGKVVPTRALGIYVLASPGHLLGGQGPFFIISFIAIMGAVFFFLLARELFGVRVAYLATFFYAFASSVIYWSNMLYANIPGVSFFFAGLYCLVMITRSEQKRYYFLGACSFALSVWLRYELFVFAVFLLPVFVRYWKGLDKKVLLVALLLFFLLLSPVLLFNKANYGSYLKFAYTASEAEIGAETPVQEDVAPENRSFLRRIVDDIADIADRFLMQNFNPDLERIAENARASVYDFYPFLVVLGALGALYALIRLKGTRAFTVSFLLIALIWTLDTCGGYHWGEGQNLVGSSYTRYLLIVYAFLAIYCSVLIEALRAVMGRRAFAAFLAAALVFFSVSQVNLLVNGNFGLKATMEQKHHFHEINGIVEDLPEDTVVAAGIYAKAITARKVLDTTCVPGDTKDLTTVEYIEYLLDSGHHVYVVEAPWHRSSYLDIKRAVRRYPGLSVRITGIGSIGSESGTPPFSVFEVLAV